MGIVNGQSVDQANTNPAFIDANQDDTTLAKLGLNDQDSSTVSGPAIINTQRELNALSTFTGKTLNGVKDEVPNYTNNEGFTVGQDLETRLDLVSGKFKQAGGHSHDPALTGDGTPIQASYLQGVVLRALILQGVNIIGHTGSSVDISAQFSLKVPSSNATTLGVVINNPQNVVAIRQASGPNQGDSYVDGTGNIVYGRITYPGSVWTLSFYTLISSVETAYNFASASDISFYYQEIFNPLTGGPTYSPDFYLPSENTTADVVDASPTQRGVVTTGAQVFAGNKEFTGDLKASSRFFGDSQVDSTATGTLAALVNPTKLMVLLTNAGLVSIQSIAPPSPVLNQNLILVNKTGVDVLVKNTNANPGEILTGTGNDITVKADQALFMSYDNINARWVICGSAGTQFVTQAFGTSPNANGYTYNAGTGQFQLQPADTLFPGGVNTLDQEFKGEKRFTEGLAFQLGLDASTVGADATIDGGTVGVVKVQNAALTSISLLIRKNDVARLFVLINGTGASIAIKNLTGTETSTAKQIRTGTGADITLASNASLFFIYDENSDKWQTVGSSSSGGSTSSGTGKNFITINPDAEAYLGATGWFIDSFVAGPKPSGTLQSVATGIQFNVYSSGALDGIRSFEYVKDAVNRQGRVAYTNFTIQPAYFAKSMKISFDYILKSGTFLAKDGNTPSDMIIYIQDVTNNTFIEPSNISLLSNSTALADKFEATFQTSSNGTSYRLLLYIGSISAAAYTIGLDNFSVSPQAYVYGSTRTDFQLQATAPVITGTGGGTLVLGTGGGAINQVEFAQDGDEVIARYTFRAGTTGFTDITGALLVPYPLGYVNPSPYIQVLGYGDFTNLSTGNPTARLICKAFTPNAFIIDVNDTTLVGAGSSYTSNNFIMTLYIRFKAQGLSSGSRKSDGYDSRKLGIKQAGFVASTPANNIIIFPSVEYSDGLTVSGGRVTIPSADLYDIDSYIGSAATIEYYIWVNGVSRELLMFTDASGRAQGSTSLYLKAGDIVDLRPGSATGGMSAYSRLSINRRQGPQTISASEQVYLEYTQSSGQSIPNNTLTTFLPTTKVEDTHGIFNTATGEITFPRSGKGEIKAGVLFNTSSPTGTYYFSIYKDGAEIKQVGRINKVASASTNDGPTPISVDVYGIAGTKYTVRVFQNTGSSLALISSGIYNYIQFSMD